jgi:hypothetical protein
VTAKTVSVTENGYKTRLTVLTNREEVWLNALMRGDMDLYTPFTAKEACEVIDSVPLCDGRPRKLAPNQFKLAYTMRKSGLFTKTKIRPRNLWVLRQREESV